MRLLPSPIDLALFSSLCERSVEDELGVCPQALCGFLPSGSLGHVLLVLIVIILIVIVVVVIITDDPLAAIVNRACCL